MYANEVAATAVQAREVRARAVGFQGARAKPVAATQVRATVVAPSSFSARPVVARPVRPTPLTLGSQSRAQQSFTRGRASKKRRRKLPTAGSAAKPLSPEVAWHMLYNPPRGCLDGCSAPPPREGGKVPAALRQIKPTGRRASGLRTGLSLLWMPMARIMSLALPPLLGGGFAAAKSPVAAQAFPWDLKGRSGPAAGAQVPVQPRASTVDLVTGARDLAHDGLANAAAELVRQGGHSVAGVLRPEDGKAFEARLPAASGGRAAAGEGRQVVPAVREESDLIRRGIGSADVPGAGVGAGRGSAPTAGGGLGVGGPSVKLMEQASAPSPAQAANSSLFQLVMAWASSRAAGTSSEGCAGTCPSETASALGAASFDGNAQSGSLLVAADLGEDSSGGTGAGASLLAQKAQELYEQDQKCRWGELGNGEEARRSAAKLGELADQLLAKNCWAGHGSYPLTAECRDLMAQVAEACGAYNADVIGRWSNCSWMRDTFQPMACQKVAP